ATAPEGGAMNAELASIRRLFSSAALTADSKLSLKWCAGQLPGLYRQYSDTRESRFGAEILRLARGILHKLDEVKAPARIPEGVVSRLKTLHERLGLPE